MRYQLTLALLLTTLTTLTLADAPPIPLRLIPTPRHETRAAGVFSLKAETPILLKSTDPEDQFAAGELASEIKQDLSLDLKISPESPGPSITLQRKSINLPPEAIPEGYLLTITPDSINLEASTSAGLFYGVQTLKQLLRANSSDNSLPAVTILDWPLLHYRGWQDDISRGPIPTLDFLKQEIRSMSQVKENFFTLYTEHVFKLEKHPDIAPPDAITADEMRELSAYAKKYHIELAGNFQSFGHFANILKFPPYAPLGANAWALDPANEAVYSFLNEVYSEIAPAYPDSSLFCISCDEVGHLDKPDVQEMIKRIGPGAVYTYHINRVASLLKSYGKTPMMWGDIALEHPENIKQLPRDLIVLPWTYGDSGTYDRWLKPYTTDGYRTIVCPGCDCWSRLWPNVDSASHNISDFTRDGLKYNTLGQLNTTWRDSGETLFGPTFYPLLWGAETSWSPITDATDSQTHAPRNLRQEKFDNAFDGVFLGIPGNSFAKANRSFGTGILSNPLAGGLMDHEFWKDPATASADAAKSPGSAEKLVSSMNDIITTATTLKSTARYNSYVLDEMIMEAKRTRFLGQRVLTTSPQDLLTNLDAIKASYIQLWNLENRPGWLQVNLAKFSKLEATISSAKK